MGNSIKLKIMFKLNFNGNRILFHMEFLNGQQGTTAIISWVDTVFKYRIDEEYTVYASTNV